MILSSKVKLVESFLLEIMKETVEIVNLILLNYKDENWILLSLSNYCHIWEIIKNNLFKDLLKI